MYQFDNLSRKNKSASLNMPLNFFLADLISANNRLTFKNPACTVKLNGSKIKREEYSPHKNRFSFFNYSDPLYLLIFV